MLLDDSLEHLGGAIPVPDAIRVDDCYWSFPTNLQAIDLRSVDTAFTCEAKLLQSALQKGPGLEACLDGAAFGFGLVAAEKDMAFNVVDTQAINRCCQRVCV